MTDHHRTITDGIGVTNSIEGQPGSDPGEPLPDSIFDPTEVKGPNEKVWGKDEDRPANQATLQVITHDVDEDGNPINDAGEPMEIKGPDPDQWGGE